MKKIACKGFTVVYISRLLEKENKVNIKVRDRIRPKIFRPCCYLFML